MNIRLVFVSLVAGTVALAVAIAPERAADARLAPDAGAIPRFDAQPFADDKTPAPTLDEWKAAPPVTLTDQAMGSCNAYRVREWIKLDCGTLSTSAIALLGGSREGVSFFLGPHFGVDVPRGGEAIFPVRRGDRRVIEWSTFGDGYNGPESVDVAFVLSESWTADELGPTIIFL